MEIIHAYRNDHTLRRSFDALAQATFGLSFENWYQMGFWGEDYDPYSIWEDGKIVANVSLNRTDMVISGQRKKLFQIGTVMTDPAYRNRGYIRAILNKIEEVTADADGIYLFANDSVVDFYPKFGFTPARETVCSKPLDVQTPAAMVPVPMDGPAAWDRLSRAMAENRFPAGCQMADNPGLIFFYAAQFLRDNVYFCENLNAWAIAEPEEGELFLHAAFSPDPGLTPEDIAAAFGPGLHTLRLGFTPADPTGFQWESLKEEDSTFFVKGPAFSNFSARKLRIPSLSHA